MPWLAFWPFKPPLIGVVKSPAPRGYFKQLHLNLFGKVMLFLVGVGLLGYVILAVLYRPPTDPVEHK